MNLLERLNQTLSNIDAYQEENNTIDGRLSTIEYQILKEKRIQFSLNIELLNISAAIREDEKEIAHMNMIVEYLTGVLVKSKCFNRQYRNNLQINRLKFDWKDNSLNRLEGYLQSLEFDFEDFEEIEKKNQNQLPRTYVR